MTTKRWQQIKTVLADTLDRPQGESQTQYLEQACADDTELYREVAALLSQPTILLENCANDLGQATREPLMDGSNTGRRVGAFVLQREIGRGGMGAVWLAGRADGHFEQQVAVKLLKRGTDTEEVLRRFRAERQILARLEHPGIARLLDGGETDDGLPFLVMEYVAGERVTDFVASRSSSVDERLRLFQKICQAVQFAHQNLVVHRDLKPGNILVTPLGEPKLLDFGIARWLDPLQALDLTLAEGGPRLTLASASPEQWRGEPLTTVSDVYSLGALLYELLTGRSPHCFANSHPSRQEIARVIGEEMPVPPSVVSPENTRKLRGDLDTIVLHALAKEPGRRYPSAAALAEDIQRFLDGQPVQARRDTAWYRTGKFLLRNRFGVAAAAMVALALAVGGASTVWQARRAERRFQDVRHLARIFLFDFHDAIETLPGAMAARQLVVSRGLEYLDNLSREAGNDRALQLELAEAYLKVGDVQGQPYMPNLGDYAGALHSYEQAAEHAAALVDLGDDGFSSRRILSQAYSSLGEVQSRLAQTAAAAENHRRALEIRREVLAENPPNPREWQQLIAASHVGCGDAIQAGNHQGKQLPLYRLALVHYRAALPWDEVAAAGLPATSREGRQLARTCSRIAGILSEMGAKTGDAQVFFEAFSFHDRNVAQSEASLREQPENASHRRNLADGLVARAYARTLAQTDLPLALDDCRRALIFLEPLAAADAANAEAQQDLGYALYNTGRVLQFQKDWSAATMHYERCRALLEALSAAYPANNEITFDLARTRQGLQETAATQLPQRE